jgi:CheY-like chemotaxis protein/HPt (histidine-containing phosphotransfer) domain-containing protein
MQDGQAHVLLLEDDPLMQRFVSYALEDFNLTLTCCDSVSQAMEALKHQSFRWILTDLMLPGESGLSFIEKISRMPDTLGRAQIVALSAGIDPSMQDTLNKLGVTRQLLKPVSVKTLQALFETGDATEDRHGSTDPRAHAIETYFAGQTGLYEKFAQQSCLAFKKDMIEGDRAIRENNHDAAHHLSHSLKSVLLLLGQTEAHHCAERLENLTKAPGGMQEAEPVWRALKNHLIQWVSNQPH